MDIAARLLSLRPPALEPTRPRPSPPRPPSAGPAPSLARVGRALCCELQSTKRKKGGTRRQSAKPCTRERRNMESVLTKDAHDLLDEHVSRDTHDRRGRPGLPVRGTCRAKRRAASREEQGRTKCQFCPTSCARDRGATDNLVLSFPASSVISSSALSTNASSANLFAYAPR